MAPERRRPRTRGGQKRGATRRLPTFGSRDHRRDHRSARARRSPWHEPAKGSGEKLSPAKEDPTTPPRDPKSRNSNARTPERWSEGCETEKPTFTVALAGDAIARGPRERTTPSRFFARCGGSNTVHPRDPAREKPPPPKNLSRGHCVAGRDSAPSSRGPRIAPSSQLGWRSQRRPPLGREGSIAVIESHVAHCASVRTLRRYVWATSGHEQRSSRPKVAERPRVRGRRLQPRSGSNRGSDRSAHRRQARYSPKCPLRDRCARETKPAGHGSMKGSEHAAANGAHEVPARPK